MRERPFLQFKKLVIARGQRPVLGPLSLTVEAGESLAIIGPNGSGKSTFVKALTRELYPWEGEVAVFGQTSWDVFDLRKQLGIVTQEVQRMAETNVAGRDIPGLEVVLSGFFSSVGVWDPSRVTPAMAKAASKALAFLGAEHLAERPLTEMSAGEARRVMIARALAHEPRALLLDEPTNSLDVAALGTFLALLRKIVRHGTGLVLVTHHLRDVIPEIGRVVLLKGGRVVADGPKEEVLTSRRMSDVFDARLAVTRREGWFDAGPA